MLLNGFRRITVSRISSIRFFSITSSTLNYDDWKRKFDVLSTESESGRNTKLRTGRNEFLPHFFYGFDKKQDIIRDCQDALTKVETLKGVISPDVSYLYKKSIDELMKYQFIQDYYFIFEMYDRYVKMKMREPMLDLPDLFYLIPTIYDPACLDRFSGWKKTLENDQEFRDSFVENYNTDDMNELLRIIWGYVHKGFSRYGDILYVNSDEYNEWNVDDIDIFEYALKDYDIKFYKTCIKAVNNSLYFQLIKCVNDSTFFSEKRCKIFLKNLIAGAISTANMTENQSISDVLRAQISIDNMIKRITPRYQNEENFMTEWCKDYKEFFTYQPTVSIKELLEVTRIQGFPLCNDTKTAFKNLLKNNKEAREIFAPLFPSDVVEDSSYFAQELWDKVSKDDPYAEDLYYVDYRRYFFTNPERFTKKEMKFLKCCMSICGDTLEEVLIYDN